VYDTLQKDGTPFPLFACKGDTNHNSGTTLLKTVGGSNPVLGEKPRKKNFALGVAQSFHTILYMMEVVEPRNGTS
jgi:hypothetical protein